MARLTPGGDIPINSDAAANVPTSTTAANTLIPLERFSLDDLMGVSRTGRRKSHYDAFVTGRHLTSVIHVI
jgi:hypothetical protein